MFIVLICVVTQETILTWNRYRCGRTWLSFAKFQV